MEKGIYFNKKFFKRFWMLLRVTFPSWKNVTVLLFIFLLSVAILEQFVVYNVGMIASRYYKVLGERDWEGFTEHSIYALILVISVAFVKSTGMYTSSVLYVSWRENITRHLHFRYFKDMVYYHLNVMDNCIDNPDQRIAQDVDKMCNELSQIIAKLLVSPFTIGYYVYQTWHTTGYIGPLCVLLFFLLSTCINKPLMSMVVEMVFQKERKEGDFRYKHMQMRVNAESAAFYRCGGLELQKTNDHLHKLICVQHKLIRMEYLLNFFINFADYTGSILSYIIVAIPIFTGIYDDLPPTDLAALISSNTFVIMYLVNCFTSLIDMASKVTNIAGTAHRVGQLLEKLSSMKPVIDCKRPWDGSLSDRDDLPGYKIMNLTYGVPQSQKPIVKDLNVVIKQGENMLISGASGCGKSSLLRVLDCLWTPTSGYVNSHLPHGYNGVFYLPQKPYFTDGTLRDQISFPNQSNVNLGSQDDSDIIRYLEEADLSGLLERTGSLDSTVDWNWYDVLSPGEMQRLSFVRLFYHRPAFAILDEATSQIGLSLERVLYQSCAGYQITVVSVGHRESLRDFHHVELKLDGEGGYTLEQYQQRL